MTQKRLNVLIIIVIESRMLDKIGYENSIKDFVSYLYTYIVNFAQGPQNFQDASDGAHVCSQIEIVNP